MRIDFTTSSQNCATNSYSYSNFSDLNDCERGYVISNWEGIATNGVAVLLYMLGIWHAVKVKASTFVKVVESLILFSVVHFLASCIY